MTLDRSILSPALLLEKYIWPKIHPEPNSGCWLWAGFVNDKGYGIIRTPESSSRKWTTKNAHRAIYEILEGPIADGLHLDHLCRTRSCVNPTHLEPVTLQENLRRGIQGAGAVYWRAKDHCPQGHEYTLENTVYRHDRIGKDGKPWRRCRQCKIQTQRSIRERHKRQSLEQEAFCA